MIGGRFVFEIFFGMFFSAERVVDINIIKLENV